MPGRSEKIKAFIESLTEAERQQLYIEYQLEKQRKEPDHLTDFKKRFWVGYVHTDFQQILDEHLNQVTRYLKTDGSEGINRLIITAPPRHGKSESVRHFVAYTLAQRPGLRVILASYSHHLAYESSRRIRNLMQSDAFKVRYPDVRLDPHRASTKQWEILNTPGGCVAAGVGGSITGFGANLICLDDPTKSRHEAESVPYRTRLKNWYNADLRTRLQPPGAIVVLATRWHDDDLPGYLLADDIENWTVLHLPALAGDDDPLGREPGAALWPERFPVSELEKLREQLGPYDFEALYQGQPIPRTDALFDVSKVEIVDVVPRCKYVVRFYDLALSTRKGADYSAGALLGIADDETVILLDMYHKQRNPVNLFEDIIGQAAIDGPDVHIRLEADNAARVQLDHLLSDERMRPFTIDAVSPVGSKYVRASPVASRVNAGKLIIRCANWNRKFLDELSVFPAGKHDDMVDALSGAYTMLSERKSGRIGFMQAQVADRKPIRHSRPAGETHEFDWKNRTFKWR